MADDKIILPDFLLAELFKDVIIDTAQNKHQHHKPKDQSLFTSVTNLGNIKLLGKNTKNVIVLTNYNDCAFLPENDFELLTNILEACHLNLSDIGIINFAQTPVTYPVLKTKLSAKNIIAFDISTQDLELPFTVPNFQVQQYDGCTFIQSPSLTVLNNESEESKLLKKDLWNSLKRMFNI